MAVETWYLSARLQRMSSVSVNIGNGQEVALPDEEDRRLVVAFRNRKEAEEFAGGAGVIVVQATNAEQE